MHYIATYTLTTELKAAIIVATNLMLQSNKYYSRQGSMYGTGLAVPERDLTWDEIKVLINLGWRTCGDNYEFINVRTEKKVEYQRYGRRHGITNFFKEAFENVTPRKVLKYQSERPDESPFAMGLIPDLRKHPEFTVAILLGRLKIYGEDPTTWSEKKIADTMDLAWDKLPRQEHDILYEFLKPILAQLK